MIIKHLDYLRSLDWPGRPLRDGDEWHKNLDFITVLENLGFRALRDSVVKNYCETRVDIAKDYIQTREVQLILSFLPHWDFYSIEGVEFSVPSSTEQFAGDIELITPLKIAQIAIDASGRLAHSNMSI